MTARIRNRRASTPAYYLARPAGLWLAALAPRPANHRVAGHVMHGTPGHRAVEKRRARRAPGGR